MSSRRLPRSLGLGAIAVGILLLGWAGLDAVLSYQHTPALLAPPAHAVSQPGTPAPDFALTTLSGETFRLSAQRGRVVVLNFWATWCPPCRYEIPDFVALQEEFGPEEVLFVGVSLDQGGPEGVAHFARQMGINYPIAIDDGAANAAYGPILSLPTTFLIDRNGEVQGYAPGMVTRDLLKPAIETLIAQPAR